MNDPVPSTNGRESSRRETPNCTLAARRSFLARMGIWAVVVPWCLGVGHGSFCAAAALPAFPGAEGAGAAATGGRGGAVYHVTHLRASGPGSLPDAVSQPRRTVVFDVSGTIDLNPGKPGKAGKIIVSQPNITIAGQTAPGDGICLKNGDLEIASHDIIVRYLRIRPGDEMKAETDALSVGKNSHNVIIDHCSGSWSTDEVLSVSGTNINHITVQWCLIAESLNHSVHHKGEHSYGSLIRADGDVTYHHNIYAHHKSRNPRPGSYGTGRGLLLDFRNNLIYDWGERAGYTSEDPATINYVGNYLKPGPSTHRKNEAFNIGGAATKIFAEANFYEGNAALNADNWKMIGNVLPGTRAERPFATAAVRTDTAPEAFTKLLAHAGATLPKRDAVDARVISEIREGRGHIINSPAEVGGWPELKSTPAPRDSDSDGIPDEWEKAHGLNPNDPADGSRAGADGYTNLEKYVNSLVND